MMVKAAVEKVQTLERPWELPAEWEWVPLGEMCDVTIGGTPSRSTLSYWGTGHTWVSIADLNGGIVMASKEQITDLGVQNSNVKEIEPGTVLMSFKLTIGKIGIAGKKLYTNEAIAALPIKNSWETNLENRFLFYALQTVPLGSEADLAVKGKTLNKQKLARILLPIPFPDDPSKSCNIQRSIVARIEELLAEVKRARTLLEQMYFVTDQMMDAALAEIFNELNMCKWPNKETLGNLITISARQVDPCLPEYKGLPHIGVDAIESKTCRLGRYRTAEEDDIFSGKYLFDSGTVRYSKIRPYLRKVVLVNFRGLCSTTKSSKINQYNFA